MTRTPTRSLPFTRWLVRGWLECRALVLATAMLVSMGGWAQTNAAPDSGLAEFGMIAERNIFNPQRTARSAAPPAPPREERRTVRVDTFALVGTLSYEKGRFAVFDGSRSEYRAVLSVGDTIAGYTIEAIHEGEVRLKSEGGGVDLRVSSGMRREDEGEWRPSSAGEGFMAASGRRGDDGGRAASSRPTRSWDRTGNAGSATASPAPAGGEDASEVLRRLMQLREQELK
ncbi:MAG: hypothetical protein KF833_06190 [Verrucomicrobiae bacterium]|nr:hypothetical protein [Verrucomicrobiae bacterium]